MALRIAAIVLAAGQSRRMGGTNKLLAEIDGVAMVARVHGAALSARTDPVIVVTGDDAEAVLGVLASQPVRAVHNPDFAHGISTSLGHGIAALPDSVDGVAICLGDMPRLTATHIDRIAGAFDPDAGRAICVPTFEGRRGNPVVWARRYFPEILALEGDAGARSLIEAHMDAVCPVVMDDDAVLVDVDRPGDLEAAAADTGESDRGGFVHHEEIHYHQEILALADDATGHGRLEDPAATATGDHPFCGDRVTIDVALAGGAVSALAHRVRGCILCQAAASIVGAHAAGQAFGALRRATAELEAMLGDGAPPPSGAWAGFGVFKPVRAHKSRHDCVLLPLRTLLEAIEKCDP